MTEANISKNKNSHELSKTFIVRSLPSPRSKPKTFGVIIMDSLSISTGALFLFLVDQGHTNIGSSLSAWSNSFPYRFFITFLFLVIIILPLLLLLIRRISRYYNVTEQNICKVQVMPLGLQITEATLLTNCIHFRPYDSKPKQTKLYFIPMSDVLDVVITEIVLGYKVINCVMFRIQTNDALVHKHLPYQSQNKIHANYIYYPSHHELNDKHNHKHNHKHKHKHNHNDSRILRKHCSSLVPAFSPHQVQMSYAECEQMWVGIMKALGKL